MSDFEGFEPANTTPVPDVLFDVLLPDLNESELKVLLYIIRRTSGFKKQTDAISLTQFQKGIRKRATGEILDRGCGVKDRSTIIKALATLETKHCIASTKADDPSGDKATSTYRILFRNEVVGKTNHPLPLGSGQNQPPWFAKPTTVVGKPHYGVVGDSNPQETVLQETVKQQTELQEGTFGADAPPALSQQNVFDLTDEDCAPDSDAGDDTVKASTPPEVPASYSTIGYTNEGGDDAPAHGGARDRADRGALDRPDTTAMPVEGEHDVLDNPGMDVRGDRGAVLAGTGGDNPPRATHHSPTPTPDSTQVAQVAPSQQTPSLDPPGDAAVAAPPSSAPSASGKGKNGKAPAEPIPDEALRILDAWDSLFKHPQPRTEKHIAAAIALIASQPSRDDLKACKDWLFTTDNPTKPWFRRIGVKLADVANNYDAWQSVQPDEDAEPEPYSFAWLAKMQPDAVFGPLQA